MLDLEKLKQAVLTFMQAKNDDEEAFTCYLATLNVHVILKLIEQNKALEADLETERLRLAACGVAALGYFDGCKDEYRSASLEDTLRLYESNKELKSQLAEYKADAAKWRAHQKRKQEVIAAGMGRKILRDLETHDALPAFYKEMKKGTTE